MTDSTLSGELSRLSTAFLVLSNNVGNYRVAHIRTLTAVQQASLESKQWTLFNMSSDLNALAAEQILTDLSTCTEGLEKCAEAMKKSIDRIQDIRKVVGIVVNAVALGGTIYTAVSTGNVSAIGAAAEKLVSSIS